MYTMPYRYGYGFDSSYLLVLLGLVLCLIAQALVKSTYAKYKNVHCHSGLTAAGAAQMILQQSGIYDVKVARIAGELTDNYNPQTKILSLSDATCNSTSVAAIGVAAHECGHAIQDFKEYAPLRIRGAMVPAVNVGATVSWPLILVGVLLGFFRPLILLGIILFSFSVLFQLVTLPVEFDASHRALAILDSSGMMDAGELKGAKKVLSAAALTYVAAAASSVLQFLRLVLIFGGRRD